MADEITAQDLIEFRQFCQQATIDQLREIHDKERGRIPYRNVAFFEAAARGVDLSRR